MFIFYCKQNFLLYHVNICKISLNFRKESYKCITDALDRLANDAKYKSETEQRSIIVDRDLIVNSVLRSKDELANFAVLKWLLDNDFSNIVIQVYLNAF